VKADGAGSQSEPVKGGYDWFMLGALVACIDFWLGVLWLAERFL
jgi:hypothetical protein